MSPWEDFDACVKFLIEVLEGIRFTNVAGDHGGPTAFGITQAEYDSYNDRKGVPRQSVRLLTAPTTSEIYREDFWQQAGCDQLPGYLKLPVFEWAVNHGVGGETKTLQSVFDIVQDGVLGPQTLRAAAIADPKQSALKFLVAQYDWYQDFVSNHPNQAKFLDGWRNRVLNVADFMGLKQDLQSVMEV